MNTIAYQFHTVIDHPKFERRTFMILMSLLFLCVAIYGFFLGKTVVAVVERRVVQSEIEIIETKMSILEEKYLSVSQNINMQTATSLGFVESKQTTYATRGNTGTAVALVQ